MNVHAYSQRSPRYADVPLGTGGGHTIGSAGCTITGAAGVLADYGIDIDPGQLNRWLCRNNGFVYGNRFVFGALDAFGLTTEVIDCRYKPAPVDYVMEALEDGAGVIAQVDFHPGGGVNQHWVRILELLEDDALIHDPWLPDGYTIYWMMPRYAHWSWGGPARAIFRLAIYRQQEGALEIIGEEEEREVNGVAQSELYTHPADRGLLKAIARRWMAITR